MRTLLLALLFVAAVTADLAPLLHAGSPTAVPGQYIVVLNLGHNAVSRDIHINALKAAIQADNDNSEIKFKYAIGSFIGFSAKLSEKFLKSELAHPEVRYIEADQVVSIYDQPAAPASPNAIVTQSGATWGIDRVSQRKLPLDGLYVYDSSAGSGVDVYVLDTGILTTHVDFEDRAEFVFSSIEGQTEDGNGHGTHCAGTIAGKEYGIAKLANLKAVKVLSNGGSGTWAGVIAGVDFVTNNRSLVRPAVASMSLGGGATAALDEAVNASIASGVPYSIAAGNSNADACLFSPAGVPLAVTVGATDDTDTRSYFSNYGKCVDIFAPGSEVKSDYIGSNTATAVLSGTSMAAPHVTGVIAIKLGLEPTLTPADITYWLVSVATNDTIINVGTDSPNSLLYSPYD